MTKLIRVREQKNISVSELAKKLQVTKMTVYNYQNGKREPNAEMVKRLAAVLDVSIEDIINCFTK